jgi:hypothetical protein
VSLCVLSSKHGPTKVCWPCWSYLSHWTWKTSQEQLGLLYTLPLPQNVKFSFTCSNIPTASACGVSISQLIRYVIARFLSLCCDVRYDFRMEAMFGSSLPPVVCRGLLSYLRYLCLFACDGVQHILCCVFLHLVFPMLPVSLDCHGHHNMELRTQRLTIGQHKN